MRLFRIFLLLVFIAVGIAAFVVLTPFGPSQETFVEIAPHTSSLVIATQLQRAGIVRSKYAFDLLRLKNGGTLKAGEYRFDHPAAPQEIYQRIVQGDVYTIALSIPEGYNIFDIAQAVEAAKLGNHVDFLAAEHTNTALIAQWSPHAESLEGYLFPDTYRFSRHVTTPQILAAMVKRFHTALTQLAVNDAPGAAISRLVTMASLVEKEVHVDAERPTVAGVFENRLRIDMPLATDPTVVYAALLNGSWRGTIYATDLQSPSPYNTYKHAGLPPGPICSPGMAALHAALKPTQTDYLYFVSDAQGHTRFSATLKEHSQKVQEYRKAESR